MDSFLSHVDTLQSPLPTFFEMFMQERILHGMRPAAHHILSVFCDRWPVFVSLLENFDEVYAFCSLLLEFNYLQKHDSLLSEHLYGMCRAKLEKQTKKLHSLSQKDRNIALLIVVMVPYLKSKLDNICNRLKEESQQNPGNHQTQSFLDRAKKCYVAVYPVLHVAFEGSFFIFEWLYLLGKSPHFSPTLMIAGQVVRRLNADDLVLVGESDQGGGALERVADHMVRWGRAGLIVGVITFKLLEWWHRGVQSGELTNGQRELQIIPPPQPIAPSSHGIPLLRDKSLCPICHQQRRTPTIAPSGYVFCYSCITNYIREHNCCPVTLLPCKEENLRKIYVN